VTLGDAGNGSVRKRALRAERNRPTLLLHRFFLLFASPRLLRRKERSVWKAILLYSRECQLTCTACVES